MIIKSFFILSTILSTVALTSVDNEGNKIQQRAQENKTSALVSMNLRPYEITVGKKLTYVTAEVCRSRVWIILLRTTSITTTVQ